MSKKRKKTLREKFRGLKRENPEASDEDFRGFYLEEAKKRDLVEINSCGKCKGLEKLTIHHATGREGNSNKITVWFKGASSIIYPYRKIYLEATRVYLNYNENDKLYCQLEERERIYFCEDCHEKFNEWYNDVVRSCLENLLTKTRGYTEEYDFIVSSLIKKIRGYEGKI